MDKLRVLIVDDEPLAREGVRTQLTADSSVEIVAECANGLEAIAAIQEHTPDLVFLDVQMPDPDGFGVVEAIGAANMPVVIFVTAYDQYALRAFAVAALDYLLKPFDEERFAAALTRAKTVIEQRRAADLTGRLQTLLDTLKPAPHYQERFIIKSGGRIFFLGVSEIDWIEAADNYVRLCAGRDSHLVRETLSHLETRLDPQRFVRIRHSAIVNIASIKELHPQFNGDYTIVLRDGTELSSSRRYRENLAALLGD